VVPAPTEVLWAVDYPDGEDRELTFEQIERELIAGAIDFSTLVWREGMDEWLEIGNVPELQTIEPPTRIVVAPPVPPAAPVRAKAASAPTIDPSQFETREAASSPGPLPPIPRAPTMSGIGRPPPPVTQPFQPFDAPPAPAAAAAVRPSFPPPPAASTPLVPAPAIAAAFAAPAQPSAAPSGAARPSAAGVPEWPEERKNRAPLILGLVIVLIAIGGGVYALKSASDDKLPPPATISALPPATPPTTHAAEPSAQTAEPPAAQTPPSAPPGTGQAAGTSRSALDMPSGPLSATPNAGFAEQFANGARNADKGGTGQRFDPNAANRALASAAFETAKCKEAGGPTGLATVVVTFDPSGKAASAVVSDPPFAGTSSGACIAATMKRATVPPFSGLPGTATKIISIQ